ncbi:LLM class F420-dependent oxidoreductase [Gordonia jinhuaensis]|uniref:LLM class F420-dependent oxidoreductase n=1 Tax=Gordonia jinhuaensis TaxID=1517702 RepID=A0A916WSP1_9ACTN|nr:LLM class F420-dependent oxidoreductase [Gordonia jinhuaensis]
MGIGSGADPDVIAATARHAEDRGFATLWCGEHVVMVDQPSSRYPYTPDGQIAVPVDADWLDPLACLGFAAAHSSTIRLATGVLLLPEHNPVIMAKQVASLDRLSKGRFTLGVGIGWSRDEFDALGVPFSRRAERTAAYLEAMRALWSTEVATVESDFVSFRDVRVNPKPTQSHVPVILGGNSDRALMRVAEWSDGWYGFNLDGLDHVADRLATLRSYCAERDRAMSDMRIAVALRDPRDAELGDLEHLGVDELVIVESPPDSADAVEEWIADLAQRWIDR